MIGFIALLENYVAPVFMVLVGAQIVSGLCFKIFNDLKRDKND